MGYTTAGVQWQDSGQDGGGGGLLVRVVAQWQSTAAGMYVGLIPVAAPPFLHSPLPAYLKVYRL